MWLTALVLCAVGFYIWRRIRKHSNHLPPGPVSLPLVGSWEFVRLYLTGGDMARMYERLGARYGPLVFMRVAMDTPVLAIRTYDVIKEASTDLQLGGIGVPYLYRQMSGWLNLGVSFAEGQNWHHNRRFTISTLGRLGFTRHRIEPLVELECSAVVRRLTEAEGSPVDVEPLLSGAALNVMLQLLVSKRFDLDDPQVLKMRSDSTTLFRIMAKIQTYLDFVPWLSRLFGDNSVSKQLERVLDTFYEFVDEVIAEHEESFVEDEEPRDLLDAYLSAARQQESAGERDLSPANLRVLLKDLVVGGLEGPSMALSWLLLLLAEHRDVQQRVRHELDTVIGAARAPTIEDQHSCPFTRAVIDETLRYVTLTPFNRHFCSAGGTTLLGYHIPAGCILLVDIHSLHQDLAVWGDPDVFRPERFLEEDGAVLRQHVRGFGYSPRSCPAEQYSRSLLFLMAAGVLQKLTLQLPEGERLTAGGGYSVSRGPRRSLLVAHPR